MHVYQCARACVCMCIYNVVYRYNVVYTCASSHSRDGVQCGCNQVRKAHTYGYAHTLNREQQSDKVIRQHTNWTVYSEYIYRDDKQLKSGDVSHEAQVFNILIFHDHVYLRTSTLYIVNVSNPFIFCNQLL